jgi:hypothetical protein
MARVILDPVKVRYTAQKLTVPLVRKMTNDTVALSKRWPRAGSPALTDSHGELNRHTTGRVIEGAGDPHGVIENDLSYALVVHQGGRRRDIFARNHRFMKFRWKRFNYDLTYLEMVVHPATKGSYFLVNPMNVVARRYGFKTSSRILP